MQEPLFRLCAWSRVPIWGVVLVALIVLVSFNCFYSVQPQEAAVVQRYLFQVNDVEGTLDDFSESVVRLTDRRQSVCG